MNSIKLTYINYLQMVIKFMSSDFFVWCFIVVNFEEIWTRPYRDVLVWRTKYNKKWSISTLREKYINWNWLDQAWGRFRDALYEMNVLYEMWSVVDFSLKMLLKLASKNVELMTWTKYAGVLLSFVDRKWFWFCIYYEVF
jgi:hypothetical protein